jgi:quinol monooxygenase YgiN
MAAFEVSAHMTIRPGQLEGFKKQAAECIRITREKDTHTLRYDWFLTNDGTECEVRERYVDPDALVDHAMHVREARETMFAQFAYDHRMAFYGEPSPRLLELVQRIGVVPTEYRLLQSLDPGADDQPAPDERRTPAAATAAT